jgi:aspartyl-tRNA(Asn)/glutamyl-tRNA(Gln) amidotransferase subunit C
MEVNDIMVNKLADLSRLHFDDLQKAEITKDLQRMIQFVEKLNELDTKGVAPLIHVSENQNVLREDDLNESISRGEGFKNTAVQDGLYFKVPKVIRK